MGYLEAHVALSLIFAQLLGLLLGWLLWGYPARQQAKQLAVLREQLADLQLLWPRVAAGKAGLAYQPLLPVLQDGSHTKSSGVSDSGEVFSGGINGDLQAESSLRLQLERELEAEEAPANGLLWTGDLEAEIKEARLQYFEEHIRFLEKQVRELEGVRDRLPGLEVALSKALAAKEAAESDVAQVHSDLGTRISSLLVQLHTFEDAAQEWDMARDNLELDAIAREKELAGVRAQLREIQNNQLPQKVESLAQPQPSRNPSLVLELADLRDRHQRVVTERDAIAAELEEWKQREGSRFSDSQRLSELSEKFRLSEAMLAEQAARVESLLWRVAELDPFAAAAARLEDEVRRQEAEINAYVALYSESSDHIRKMLTRVAELEGLSNRAAEREAVLENKNKQHRQVVEALSVRVQELEGERISLNAEVRRAVQAIGERDAQIERLAQQHEIELTKLQQTMAEQRASSTLDLERILSGKEAEVLRLSATGSELQAELGEWKIRAAEAENAQQAQAAELNSRMTSLEERHQAEAARLKLSLALRLRRFRQSL